jgi:protein gp37
MGANTKIPWCDSTINPIVGCDGCELHRAGQPGSHCYAAGLVRRYAGLAGWLASFDRPEFFAGRIEKACNWPDLTGKKRAEKPWLNGFPRLIFVCDLADPFTEGVDPESWLTPALPRMAESPHIFLLLTKRGRRMSDYFERYPVPRNFWLGVTVTGPDTTARID